ncbi:ribosomal protein S18-alanine N-acetyltransferase [bacterium]|nr:ribosomal protein S18-alanine N-acetyltransferase [bacterium]MBU1598679.1 ribosomal protein S18-alanine N-acetyltransferase [bacterium]
MKEDDLAEVLAIEEEVFAFPWRKESFVEEIKGGSEFYVAKEEGKIIGYLGFYKIEDEMQLVNLAVTKSRQGKGIGSDLLKWALKLAKSLGAKKAILEVEKENLRAISFYHKFGFYETGLRKGYYEGKKDAVIMWADILG